MDWESEENEATKEKKDMPKRVWYIIFAVSIALLGVLYAQESQKVIKKVGVHSKHILITVDASRSRKEALERAQDVKRQLDEGAVFSAMAAEYSDEPNAEISGGNLGWIEKKGVMTEPFDAYIWKGPVGAISEPVLTSFGYHIIVIIERNFSDADEYQKDINRRLQERMKENN